MGERPLLRTADAIIRPGLEYMYSARPKSFQHINLRSGRYWHPFLGFRAQAAKALARLSNLAAGNSLRSATGTELQDYVASEYSALPDLGRLAAIGEISLTRTTSTTAGDVPKGTRFVRKANALTQIPVKGAEYITLANAHFEIGQTVVDRVPIQAVVSGSDANHPIRTDSVDPGVGLASGKLFDTTITVSSFSASGGADGAADDYVRRFATAFSIGQYGPTSDETRYGALSQTGVRNLLVFDLPGAGTQKVLVADSSWASSRRWAAFVQQQLYDNDFVGFGCKVEADVIRNQIVSIEATVALRDKNFMTETTDIDAAVGDAVRTYFDDRLDWNVWKTSHLAAAITRSHPKVFHCSSVIVKDGNGTPLSEIVTPNYALEQFHYFLANNACKITYTGPV